MLYFSFSQKVMPVVHKRFRPPYVELQVEHLEGATRQNTNFISHN